ncbi:MAG: hypothetical protein QXX19_03475 [Candidatus Caldarchaeum sp.]
MSHKCPLCGTPVSWSERQAGLYACLTVCVPLVPFPRHLVEKHPSYLQEAKRLARPVMYTALSLAAAAALLFLSGFYAASALAGAVCVVFFMVGWNRRRRLIHRFQFSATGF